MAGSGSGADCRYGSRYGLASTGGLGSGTVGVRGLMDPGYESPHRPGLPGATAPVVTNQQYVVYRLSTGRVSVDTYGRHRDMDTASGLTGAGWSSADVD